jgi:uncharacterized protein RhaS with RHS repeats
MGMIRSVDLSGRMTSRELANGVTIERTFDAAGREIVYTAQYDAVGNRLAVQEYDGTLVTHGYYR